MTSERNAVKSKILTSVNITPELEALPIKFRPRGLRQARLALDNLEHAVRAGEKDYSKHYEILILKRYARLRGSRLTGVCQEGSNGYVDHTRTGTNSISTSRTSLLRRCIGRATMLSCMIWFQLANFLRWNQKTQRYTLFEDSTTFREWYDCQVHGRASSSLDNDCMAHIQCSV